MSISSQLSIRGARVREQKLVFRALEVQSAKSFRCDVPVNTTTQRTDNAIVRAGSAA
jgi:hypothetical protein